MNIANISAKYRKAIYWLDSKGFIRTADVLWTAFFRVRRALFGKN